MWVGGGIVAVGLGDIVTVFVLGRTQRFFWMGEVSLSFV